MKRYIIVINFLIFNFASIFAQIYSGTTGNYVVKKSDINMTNYTPRSPKVSWDGLLTTVALNLTTDFYETRGDLYRDTNKAGMKLHIYAPQVLSGQSASSKPLQVIVFGYGGGFISPWSDTETRPMPGNADAMPKWLAKQGYIVVCPEYRIGVDLYTENLAKRAIWRALQDLRMVIKYARTLDTVDYSVNPLLPLVYVGWSSGALMGLHNLYMNDTNRPIETTNNYLVKGVYGKYQLIASDRYTNDLGGIDSQSAYNYTSPTTTGNPVQDITVAISGAIGKMEYLSNAIVPNTNPKALMLIHHPLDGVVPYASGQAFKKYLLFYDPRYNYPSMFGSSSINDFYTQNPSKKPSTYSFLKMDPNCTTSDCIKGDAGGLTFLTPTWYHNPSETATNSAVMNKILYFIQLSTTNIANNVSTAKASDEQTFSKVDLIANNISLALYPNPVSGDYMNITAVADKTPYKIINLLGQEVASGKIDNGLISVVKITAGTYTIEFENNNERIVKRFIKQ